MAAEARGTEFRDVLRVAVGAVRGAVDAVRYAEIVLGLVFLRYLSSTSDFSLPPTASWSWIETHARRRGAGRVLDEAVKAIEVDGSYPALAGILTGVFGSDDIDQDRLADLVDLLNARWASYKPVSAVLDEEYSLFLDGFARFEGRLGGDFQTPRSVTRLVLEILQPYWGRVYDPACGAASMLAQLATDSLYGQEREPRVWNLARMNLIVHGVHAPELGAVAADTLSDDQHPDLRADFVMAHPPFSLRSDDAWLQHVIAKLSPEGTAAVILPRSSLHARKAEIRRSMVEDDVVACVIALPDELFPSTTIPACLWVLHKDKSSRHLGERTDRSGQTLFIDATGAGTSVSKTERVLEDADRAKITKAYSAWLGWVEPYHDEPGFCFSASLETIRANQYSLNPALYVTPAPPDLTQDLYAIFDGYDFPLSPNTRDQP